MLYTRSFKKGAVMSATRRVTIEFKIPPEYEILGLMIAFIQVELQKMEFKPDPEKTLALKILHQDTQKKKDSVLLISGTIVRGKENELKNHARVIDVLFDS